MEAPTCSATTATPRLLLVRPDPSSRAHADFIVRLYNTPQFIASIGGKPTAITTHDAAAGYIRRRFASEHERNGYGTYLIVLKPGIALGANNNVSESTSDGDGTTKDEVKAAEGKENVQPSDSGGTLIGTVSLSRGEGTIGKTCYGAPDLGFAVLPEYCRRGIATEASRGVLDWASREKGVDVVLGLHDPTNVASAGVLRKLGFEERGERKLTAFGGNAGLVWTWRAGGGNAEQDNGLGVTEEEVMALGLPALGDEH
ncbi:acyl-CoA N-acyltransferase [Microdochium trichocladiopsis]|uniref:Acyl-CoA N-acyltransferase n=1 Tax=Microdochium trichocladiopsis TaxID=1682393 RepID=A0A9P8Y465_9PEZI|nr:acyl-CoA N-acyltransferase [Microdochium trichocladiopsis]KAH7028214.1 acyl-CoA N-acyltransferase [Microdochium trichocladiopsis]